MVFWDGRDVVKRDRADLGVIWFYFSSRFHLPTALTSSLVLVNHLNASIARLRRRRHASAFIKLTSSRGTIATAVIRLISPAFTQKTLLICLDGPWYMETLCVAIVTCPHRVAQGCALRRQTETNMFLEPEANSSECGRHAHIVLATIENASNES